MVYQAETRWRKGLEPSIQFKASLPMLQPMMEWIREQIQLAEFPKTEAKQVEIALEEVIVNIIHYAYEGKMGTIELKCHVDPNNAFTLIVQDYGKPFNPLEHKPQVDKQKNLDEREVGGLGIFLVKKFIDKIEYSRLENANVLSLTKKITKK